MLESLVVVAVLIAEPAPSATERALEHVRRAEAYSALEQWDNAAQEMVDAYADDPRPEFLYARAQIERKRENCAEAIDLYEQYIETAPSTADVSDAKRHLQTCREVVRAAEPAPPAVAPPSPQPDPVPAEITPPPTDAPRRWQRDPWAASLAGVGLAGTVVGVGLLAGAASNRNADVDTEGAYRDRLRRANALTTAGITVTSIGAALVVGAVIRWATVARRERRQLARRPADSIVIRF